MESRNLVALEKVHKTAVQSKIIQTNGRVEVDSFNIAPEASLTDGKLNLNSTGKSTEVEK